MEPTNKRRQLTKCERAFIYKKTNGHCAYCGFRIQPNQMAVDHVKPVSRGGATVDSNLIPACRSCNHRKSNLDLEDFRKQVEKFPAVLARDSVTYRNAVRFGLVVPNPQPVIFYFERSGYNG